MNTNHFAASILDDTISAGNGSIHGFEKSEMQDTEKPGSPGSPTSSPILSALQVFELSMLKVGQDLLSKLEDLSADSETLDRLNRLRM